MKNIVIIVGLLFLFFSSQAQKKKKSKDDPVWFNLEAKAGVGTGLLINKNISSDDQINQNGFQVYPTYGIGLGVHFPKGFGVQVEKSWMTFGQKYTYKNSLPDQNLKLSSDEWGFFIRKSSEGDSFIGLGIKAAHLNHTSIDSLDQNFKKNFAVLNLEFGGPIWLTNIFDINVNLRFGYGLSDIVSNKNYQPGAYKLYSSYKPTSPLIIQIMIGFNWHVGFWANSNCKHTGFLFFTN